MYIPRCDSYICPGRPRKGGAASRTEQQSNSKQELFLRLIAEACVADTCSCREKGDGVGGVNSSGILVVDA